MDTQSNLPPVVRRGQNMEFSRLEQAVMGVILSRSVKGMEVVRMQFAAASVVQRDHTTVGFFTKLSVPSSVPPMPDSKELREVLFDGAGGYPTSDPEGWVLFILWTEGRYISCLEGFTVRDSWPNEDDIEYIVPVGKRSD